MIATPRDALARALDLTGDLVAGVHPQQWTNGTPCTDWTVQELVNHLVGGHRLFAGLLGGAPSPSLAEQQRMQDVDQLGEDPVTAYRGAADALLAAFDPPGVLERTVTLPIGPLPGLAALQLRITETLVHGWDLAQATDQPTRVPDELAEPALAFTRQALPGLPPGRRPFAPPQPVDASAPAIDRLVALLGRPVSSGDR